MAVSFKIKPRKSQKRQSTEPQGEPVQCINATPKVDETDPYEPQWFERPHQSLEMQLQLLPEAPTDSDYELVPIDVFSRLVMTRITEANGSRKKPRNAE